MKHKADNKLRIICTRAASLLLGAVLLIAGAVPVLADPPGANKGNYEVVVTPPEVEGAPYIYLYNFENDMVLYEKGDQHQSLYPTSTVKMMTGIVAIEALGDDKHKTITVTADMLERASDNVRFVQGEVVDAEQLLYATLVGSSNNAAVILAHMIAGSKEDFVTMMNEKAYELGMLGTVYGEPTGLHSDGSFTTIADTAILAKHAYENPYFMEIVSTGTYAMAATNMSTERKIHNTNYLVSRYYRGDYYYDRALGMNAGSTVQGGYTSVSVARSSDGSLTYLCIIMGAERIDGEGENSAPDFVSFSGAVTMLDWAMSAYGYCNILKAGTILCEVPVALSSSSDYVTLVPATPVSVYLPTEVDPERHIRIISATDENITAPIAKGQSLGYAKVVYNGQEIGRTELIATSDIERSEFLFALERISNFTKSKFFIATVLSALVLSVVYILIQARVRQKRLRSRVPRYYRR